VRFLLRRRVPAGRILFVESGSREISERLLPTLWRNHGAPVDVVTCFPGLPQGLPPGATVFRTGDYRGRSARKRLYRVLRARRYALLGILCSGERIMTKWKWALALQIPAKIFIVNENADYFWLDRLHLGPIWGFVLFRTGLAGTGAVRTIARVVSFPFTLIYLLLYAATVHAVRALRRG